MKNKMRKWILATASVVFLTANLTFAGYLGIHRSSQRSAGIELARTSKVPGGPTLEPGSYKVVLLNDSSTREVGFYRNGELIGQAPVKLVDQGKKFRETEVDANILDDHSEVMTEMRLSGWTERVVFSESDASSASGQ